MLTHNLREVDENHGPSPWHWSLTAALLLLAALASPSFFGRIYTHDDLGCFHLPIRAFYAEQLARREPVDWMPSLFCGFDLTGEGQGGTYHPWHWLLYRVMPLSSAWTGELLANYALLLAGTYYFLRRWRMPAEAAMFGGLVFTFSGFNLLRLVHPNAVAIIAHLPWLLWAIDRVLRRSPNEQPRTGLLWIALLTASQILLGYPQYVWFSLLVEAAYVVFVQVAWKGAENGSFVLGSPHPDPLLEVGWDKAAVAAAGPPRTDRNGGPALASRACPTLPALSGRERGTVGAGCE